MRNRVKLVAIAIAAIAVVVLAYALLTPQTQTESNDHMGMFGNHMSYGSGNVGLIAVSSALIVLSLMIMVLWRDYEPLPPSMVPASSRENPTSPVVEGPQAVPTELPTPSAHEVDEEEAAAREYLVLRLLSGDERTMFKAIMDSGGEALQKDLIVRTKMSNAKVSRLLDRLLQKGVITKERHGATNKVRIKPE